jgi:hypothetical protein
MARAAGSGSHYSFVLRNLSTGRYDKNVTIDLPSVTTIIGETLAKPMLVGWAYRTTRDNISGMVDVLVSNQLSEDNDALIDLLRDADMLEEYLKDNKLRPDDLKNIAADRGTAAHDFLERLALAALRGDSGDADAIASRLLAQENAAPTQRAVAGWWLERQPSVVMSEALLISLDEQFAGTVDLVWNDFEDNLVITDLKSRKTGGAVYESDHIQCGAYTIAWEERDRRLVDRTTVLVVREDGSWIEEEPTFDATGVFLDLLSAYRKLNRR